MAHKNIIELNGKQYDAHTGAIVGESKKSAQPLRQPGAHRGRAMDGFFRANGAETHRDASARSVSAAGQSGSAKSTPQVSTKSSTAPRNHADVTRPGKKIVAHHPAQKPKTLMRSAVTKPEFKRKQSIKTQAPAEVMAAPIATIVPKASVMQVSPGRRERAQRTPQNRRVQHFNASTNSEPASESNTSNVPASVSHDAAQPQPLAHISHTAHPAAQRQFARGTQYGDVRAHSSAQQTTRPISGTSGRSHTTTPAAGPPADIFEAALARATSHEQTYHQPPKAKRAGLHIKNRKLIGIGVGFGTLLILGGFIAYANMPGIEIRLASANAGFHAKLPGYQPTGYAFDNNIKSTSGAVSFSYRSGDSTLTITQQPSSWDSQTLYENAIAFNNQKYKSVQSQGRTVYIYNQGDTASWVSGGIRYDITGIADLTTDQVTNLAASM